MTWVRLALTDTRSWSPDDPWKAFRRALGKSLGRGALGGGGEPDRYVPQTVEEVQQLHEQARAARAEEQAAAQTGGRA